LAWRRRLNLTGIRVLIVEDDDDARALVAKVLKPVQPAELITVVASLATRRN